MILAVQPLPLGWRKRFLMVFGVAGSSPLRLALEGVLHTKPISCSRLATPLF